jgi:ribonucleases P/MRP protein subunit RPP40
LSAGTKAALRFKQLYVTFVRPHLEYASSAWNPYRIGDENGIENIQRRATKLGPSLKRLSNKERVEKLGLTTLKKRRERGDIIQYYKIVKGLNILRPFELNLA